jgi:DNA-binding winged helix-turn-helix (wHTH) protein
MDCPSCGAVIDAGAPKPLLHEVFDDARRCIRVADAIRWPTPMQWRILRLLRERFRRCVSQEFLAQAAALNPADGGSVAAVKVQLIGLRRKLAGTPFAIASFHGQGYGLFWADEVEVVTGRNGHHHTRIGSREIRRKSWRLAT